MSRNSHLFCAALLFVTAITTSSQFVSDAQASTSESDKAIYCEARRIVMPYDAFFNSVIVSVNENVVTVSGYIDSHSAKREIIEGIASLHGVKRVRNDVIVRAR